MCKEADTEKTQFADEELRRVSGGIDLYLDGHSHMDIYDEKRPDREIVISPEGQTGKE